MVCLKPRQTIFHFSNPVFLNLINETITDTIVITSQIIPPTVKHITVLLISHSLFYVFVTKALTNIIQYIILRKKVMQKQGRKLWLL